MNWILCGPSMCGKTTTGRILAKQLGRNFIDIDELVENAYYAAKGKAYSCRQIFKREGQHFFRSLESDQVAGLKGVNNSLISTGGGTLCYADNAKQLQSLGVMVYLKTDPKILWKRISSGGRPAYLRRDDPENDFYQAMRNRAPIFEESADFIIEADLLSPEEIAAAIRPLVQNKTVEINRG